LSDLAQFALNFSFLSSVLGGGLITSGNGGANPG